MERLFKDLQRRRVPIDTIMVNQMVKCATRENRLTDAKKCVLIGFFVLFIVYCRYAAAVQGSDDVVASQNQLKILVQTGNIVEAQKLHASLPSRTSTCYSLLLRGMADCGQVGVGFTRRVVTVFLKDVGI